MATEKQIAAVKRNLHVDSISVNGKMVKANGKWVPGYNRKRLVDRAKRAGRITATAPYGLAGGLIAFRFRK